GVAGAILVLVVDAVAPGGTAAAGSWLPAPGVLVARDNFDLGNIRREIERETFRTVVGIEGDLSSAVSYNVSYTYGRTEENNEELNNRSNLRWFAAIDAVRDPTSGAIVCRSTLDPSAEPTSTPPPGTRSMWAAARPAAASR
ncbi:MAG TPA: hypothetical protein PKA17_03535, partial [Phenylobacterium sp.]|nr:hypothetical protein [Phenylobacterium sp.]